MSKLLKTLIKEKEKFEMNHDLAESDSMLRLIESLPSRLKQAASKGKTFVRINLEHYPEATRSAVCKWCNAEGLKYSFSDDRLSDLEIFGW